ncbi:MAG: UDP-N-acetylenolpyruvoylglucosamine reductase [Myxococcales bacterium]|nr:UDP-N-acetylenolpyruvoylglucosamine reductase [Myxococcales bacterium]
MRDEDKQAIVDALAGDGEVTFDEPMARHTTLRIGGPVDAWVAPGSVAALERLRAACHARGLVSRGFGSGSNLLVRDGGIRGVAITLRKLGNVTIEKRDADGSAVVWLDAGASTGKVLSFCTRESLGGVEFLGGVPGTVGGGMIMNAGTYLGEFKDVTTEVHAVDERGEAVVRDNAACGFRYRHSDIPPLDVVTGARLRLPSRPREEIDKVVRELRDRRKAREPHGVPNAGSIFKNPPNEFAGRLIEQCGLKGRRVGGAEVSPAHANWLVNAGGATAKDFLELVEIVRAAVVERFAIRLELEVKVVGEDA